MVNALPHLSSPPPAITAIMFNYTIIKYFNLPVYRIGVSTVPIKVCACVCVCVCGAQGLLIYAWQIFSIQTHNFPSLLIKSIQSTILIPASLPLYIYLSQCLCLSFSRCESFFVLPGQKSRNHKSVKSKCRHFVVPAAKLSDFLSASAACRESSVCCTPYFSPHSLPPRTHIPLLTLLTRISIHFDCNLCRNQWLHIAHITPSL